MLWNDFYKIEEWEASANSLNCRMVFSPEHEIFSGHFPGQPVVPGVCMMEIVRELLERFAGQSLWLREAAQVKFLHMILPDSTPRLEIRWDAHGDQSFRVQALMKEGSSVMFRLQGIYEFETN